jgi:hypothetical protein
MCLFAGEPAAWNGSLVQKQKDEDASWNVALENANSTRLIQRN